MAIPQSEQASSLKMFLKISGKICSAIYVTVGCVLNTQQNTQNTTIEVLYTITNQIRIIYLRTEQNRVFFILKNRIEYFNLYCATSLCLVAYSYPIARAHMLNGMVAVVFYETVIFLK